MYFNIIQPRFMGLGSQQRFQKTTNKYVFGRNDLCLTPPMDVIVDMGD